jgi:ABC-2 type transport system ATP-binding protein
MDELPTTERAPESGAVLEARGLTRAYGVVIALAPLDLEVAAGECVALMGPNGSGKTTAAGLICGLLEPTEGWAKVSGHSVHHEPEAVNARRLLAYVPDSPALYDDMTVADHLRLVAAAHGVAGDDLEARCKALLQRFGLEERADFLPTQLSRGMRQKTAIACALIRPFKLLVLDEPVVGLDRRSVDVLAHVVRECLADRRAVLLMTHSETFAAEVATRSLLIEEGRVVEP